MASSELSFLDLYVLVTLEQFRRYRGRVELSPMNKEVGALLLSLWFKVQYIYDV